MKIAKFIPFALGLALLAGCAPTKEQFDTFAVVLQGSKKARQEAVQQCIRGEWGPDRRRMAALIADTSEKNAPQITCSRFVTAVAAGRITHADMVDMANGRPSPRFVKALQGR